MTVPLYNLTDTWNSGATVFTAIKMNVTDTSSSAASLLMDLQVGSVSKCSVAKDGSVTALGEAIFGPSAGLTGQAYHVFNVGGNTTGISFALVKDRDGTNPRRYQFFDCGGLPTDGDGGGFWRGLFISGPNITDPSGGAMVFPSTSFYYEYDTLTAPTTRNFVIEPANDTSTTRHDIDFRVAGLNTLIITKTRSVVVGDAAISTSATDGFFYIPTCAGTPTGTPTALTGRVPMIFDTTNSQFWFYTGGAWKQPKTPAGAATVTWQ